MRKFGLVVLLLMATFGLSASPNTAAAAAPAPLVSDVSTCPAVKLTAPADGAVLDRDYKVRFTWSAEPKGTKTRDWVSIKLDVKNGAKFSVSGGTHAAADRGAQAGAAGAYDHDVVGVVFNRVSAAIELGRCAVALSHGSDSG
mgnify:CR=1 FL=1